MILLGYLNSSYLYSSSGIINLVWCLTSLFVSNFCTCSLSWFLHAAHKKDYHGDNDGNASNDNSSQSSTTEAIWCEHTLACWKLSTNSCIKWVFGDGIRAIINFVDGIDLTWVALSVVTEICGTVWRVHTLVGSVNALACLNITFGTCHARITIFLTEVIAIAFTFFVVVVIARKADWWVVL